MKYAISNIAWKPHENFEIFKLMKDKGFDGLEIAPSLFMNSDLPYETDSNLLIKLKSDIERKGIKLISMQSILYNTKDMDLFINAKSRENLSNLLKRAIDFASVLGLTNIVFGSPKNRIIPNEMNCKVAENISINFFKLLGDYAFERGTCIGFEANAKEYGGNWMVNTLQVVEFIKKVNSKGLKLNLDTGTMIINKEDVSSINDILYYINHIHISEPFLELLPKNVKFHKKMATLIKSTDYEGYLSIEMKSVGEENFKNVEHSLEFINEVYR